MRVKKYEIFNFIYIIIGVPLLFFMIMSSRMLSGFKIVLLILFILMSALEILTSGIKINKNQLIYILIFVGYFMLSLFWGILNGYEFDIRMDFSLIQYYILTPVGVLLGSTVIRRYESRKDFLWNVLKYLSLLLGIVNIVAILAYKNGINLFIFKFVMVASDVTVGKLAVRMSNEISYMFLLPIYIVFLMDGKKKNKKDIVLYVGIVILGMIYSLISGRKMLQLIVLFTFIVAFLWNIKTQGIKYKGVDVLKRIVLIIISVAGFSLVFDAVSDSLNVGNLVERALETLKNGLSIQADGMSKRVESIDALFNLWMQSPVIGNGLNSYSEEMIASPTTKWSYEVVYNALLAQVGIIGLIIVGICVLYVLKRLQTLYKSTFETKYFALGVAFVSFLICGATNPLVYLIWPWTIMLVYCSENIEQLAR